MILKGRPGLPPSAANKRGTDEAQKAETDKKQEEKS